MNSSTIITKYAKSSEHICLCSTISICLILIFIFSPINKFIMASTIGKLIILILLAYTMFNNIQFTNTFSRDISMYLANGQSSHVNTNIICSYVFSLFLFVLILSVLRSFFR
jgi:hypothetical protein